MTYKRGGRRGGSNKWETAMGAIFKRETQIPCEEWVGKGGLEGERSRGKMKGDKG